MKKHVFFILCISLMPTVFAKAGPSGGDEQITQTIEILPPGEYTKSSVKGEVIAAAFEEADISGEKAKLVRAVKDGDISTVEDLLAKGIDANWKDRDGLTALMWAASMGNAEIVKVLLASGADANVINKQGDTALVLAKQMRHTKVVELLLVSGANANTKYSSRRTTFAEINIPAKDAKLIKAAEDGDLAAVQKLLAEGADVNAQNKHGRRPLTMAAWSGNAEIVNLLLANGADVNANSQRSYATALSTAALKGHIEIVKILLDNGADIHAKDRSGETSLMLAASTGHTDIVELLLANGADVNAESKTTTALTLAASGGHIKTIDLLLDNGADINAKAEIGMTPLIGAVVMGETETVKHLLANGADVNAKSRDGTTALIMSAQCAGTNYVLPGIEEEMEAAKKAQSKIIELLLAAGADINAETKDGQTAMMWAERSGNSEIIKLLSDKGAAAYATYTTKEILIVITILISTLVLVSKFSNRVGIIIFGCLLIIMPLSNIILQHLSGCHYPPVVDYLKKFVALFCILAGSGILLRKNWARIMAVIFSIAVISISLAAFFFLKEMLFAADKSNLFANIVMLIYGSSLFYFFSRSRTKEAFKNERPKPPLSETSYGITIEIPEPELSDTFSGK